MDSLQNRASCVSRAFLFSPSARRRLFSVFFTDTYVWQALHKAEIRREWLSYAGRKNAIWLYSRMTVSVHMRCYDGVDHK